MRRGGGAQLGVFQLFLGEANGIGETYRQLVMTGGAGVQAAGFFFDHAPELARDLRIGAGEITQHTDARHGGAELIVLNRPGANLIHGGRAVAHGLQEWMFDADLWKRLDILFQFCGKFAGSHLSHLEFPPEQNIFDSQTRDTKLETHQRRSFSRPTKYSQPRSGKRWSAL